MSIKLKFSDDDMRDPRIAQAVVELMTALSGPAGKAVGPVRRAVVAQSTFAEFEEALPERSQRFLSLLRKRRTLTVAEVVEALDLSGPKAVGGIIGAIARWAPNRGLTLPYEATRIRGQRAWRWTGGPEAAAPARTAAASPRASERPLQIPSATVATPGMTATSVPLAATQAAPLTASARVQSVPPAPAAPDRGAPNLDGLMAALPNTSRRFVELLREERRIEMPQLLSVLGLARAAAVQELLRPVRAMGPDFGFTSVFETGTNDAGDRVFLWPGTSLDATQVGDVSPLAVTPGSELVAPDEPAANVIPLRSAKQVAPGLMRRRRA